MRSSWVVVGSVREVAQELALVPLPDDVDVCLAEAEELLFARDRITCALSDRVGRVHRAGQAKQHGHASTRSWLRTAGGMTVGGAGRLLTLGAELPRLPVVWEKFAAGELAAGVVEAICAAVAGLTDEQAALAEPILVELASKAGAAEVAKAGRHLRAVLDPDGEERDERADYGRRFLRVRPGKGGGVEGEFYLPRESGARLMTLLHEYAKKKADGDDRTLTERQADALIAALLEQQIVTELLVVVSAESLPTDPENTDTSDSAPDDSAADLADGEADDTGDSVPSETGSADDPTEADDAVSGLMSGPGAECAPDAPDIPSEFDTAEAETEAEVGAGSGSHAGPDRAADAWAGSTDDTVAPAPADADDTSDYAADAAEADLGDVGTAEADPASASAEDGETVITSSAEGDESAPAMGGDGAHVATQGGAPHATRRASAWPADGGRHAHTAPSDTAPSDTASTDAMASDAPVTQVAPSEAASSEAAQTDPPPEDVSAHHTHAGPRPAGDCRHGQGVPGAAPGVSAGIPPGALLGTALGASLGHALGASLGVSLGMAPGTAPGMVPGMAPGTAPGLLLATGQVLPVSSVHRLARTSTLVRIVMNAEGQVLDMGRKVRLATPAQRRAIFARYATCWIDGCPLPATMCQIDHADNWSTGGLTDLKLLGPACQFHNRDRYQHPERYTRRKEGTDRWAFTYHRIGSRRLRV
ncbi:DUF222 domain-containing protein [Microbispora hainanensis]|uniref:DUF222 domain-containing protein n=1 Tax=Microbispora hainanensis TaxID=568844 RepID=UPI0033EC1B56